MLGREFRSESKVFEVAAVVIVGEHRIAQVSVSQQRSGPGKLANW